MMAGVATTHYGQAGQPDGWDAWQALSYGATGLSLASLVTGGKAGKEFGQWGTILGLVSSGLHWLIAPPRCERCTCRMTRQPLTSVYTWWCQSCGHRKK